jgi:hypothetical protein
VYQSNNSEIQLKSLSQAISSFIRMFIDDDDLTKNRACDTIAVNFKIIILSSWLSGPQRN